MPRLADFARVQTQDPALTPKVVNGAIVETYCNVFVQRCARSEGISDLDNLMAVEILGRFKDKTEWWKELDVDAAQATANNGHFVVAGAYAVPPDVHAHVCLVVPGQVGWSGKHACDLPLVANVGKDNFYGKIASYAFPPSMPPRFWTWIGT